MCGVLIETKDRNNILILFSFNYYNKYTIHIPQTCFLEFISVKMF